MLLLILGAALSTWITRQFGRQDKLPGYTAPFILSVWVMLALCHYLFPSLLLPPAETVTEQIPNLSRAFSLNIGQVMFQGHILSGLLFLAAILVNSRLNALYTLWGAALPLAMIAFPVTDMTAFNLGLLGYNGVLCAIALGSKSIKGAVLATVAVLLSIGLQMGGTGLGITTLTAPFVLAVWMTRTFKTLHDC